MKNIKDQVYQALLSVTENVSDVYPSQWSEGANIQLTEEENRVQERTGNSEQKAYVRIRIDVWHRVSTSQVALEVDRAVSALGLVRTSCADAPDPSPYKHKQMRYEGIIDMESDYVFWNN
ncbi:MAG: hypothetical protein IKE58_10130 [Blautia sp.]|nr:hypothetical protein [Blautia sp.]